MDQDFRKEVGWGVLGIRGRFRPREQWLRSAATTTWAGDRIAAAEDEVKSQTVQVSALDSPGCPSEESVLNLNYNRKGSKFSPSQRPGK